MNVFCFGAGKAGGRVVEQLLQYERQLKADFIVGAAACDTTAADLDALEQVPEDARVLFGTAETNGEGFEGDAAGGTEAAKKEHRQLLEPTDDAPIAASDAFVVCAGLGGGTGGPTAAVIAERLSEMYDQPVYGVGVFSTSTTDPQRASNTLRSLRRLVSTTDHVFGFDTASRVKEEPVSDETYDTLNAELARRLGTLFAAGEVTTADDVGESVVDASEIMNTLRGGGLATLGYSERPLPPRDTSVRGRLKRLIGDDTESVDQIDSLNRITTQTREAVRGQLTLPCDIGTASRGLLVITGRPAWLNRDAISQNQGWLEDQTGSLEVRNGDDPRPDADALSVLVVLGGVAPPERLTALQAVADGDDTNDD
ncbi:tubulin/FtsZ family protein [Haloferax sp. ATB1]|uniref:tubulin/FtsZ family protein n=1 Tax=Haloferax sp. ATB1 TaxID=1508454 RepID=UPI0005B233E7|nr:tubulin/FtsZ family protein [Haloferax sp. ATB1]